MRHPVRHLSFVVLSLVLAAWPAARAAAEPRTTSDLLLPYFEVELGAARTTLFSLGNGKADPARVNVGVYSNWGVPVLRLTLDLDPGEVVDVDLREWIEAGRLPAQTLGPAQLAHLQAALTGRKSPSDGLYYGTPVEPELAVGFVTFRTAGNGRPRSLWGDYSWIETTGDAAESALLVDVDARSECRSLCDRHLVRFLDPADLVGTRLVVWTDRFVAPSPLPEPPSLWQPVAGGAFYRRSGVKFDERVLDLPPVGLVTLADLHLAEDAGWIDLVSERRIFVATRYRSTSGSAAAVESWCQEEAPPAPLFVARPAIDIEKLTNGLDADTPPGPVIEVGSAVTWEYVVTNRGNVPLHGIVVSDNRGVAVSCPGNTLAAGHAMTCTGAGVAELGPYGNIGTVTGQPPSGTPVSDSDPSHYRGVPVLVDDPAIALEKLTNGHTADSPPGPTLVAGDPVTWTYSVINVGGVELTGVTVVDSDPAVAVSCPKTTLAVLESMICSASGTAVLGQYVNLGTASGSDGAVTVESDNPSHYYGVPEPPEPTAPAIAIEKLTNGYDADGVGSAPHLFQGQPVLWTYVVTNAGDVALTEVSVSDDDPAVEVSCPQTALAPGEQMLCTAGGTAVAGYDCYSNVGTVVGTPPEGDDVTDSDPSHYCAEEVLGVAAIAIEKRTNGIDADLPPGPALLVGDNVQWTYEVTNAGDVTLTGVTVEDDQGVAVTCPGGQPFALAPGAAKTCFGNGVATLGQYANVGTATGDPEGGGEPVSASDPSHYFGEEEDEEEEGDDEELGDQGCTPGYWKNHADSWPPTDFATGQAVEEVFAQASLYPDLGGASLLDALSFQGGPGLDGAAGTLLRAAVAALLNAAHPGVDYPQALADVVSAVDAALASEDRDTMIDAAGLLDDDNNRGCPLD